MDTQGLLSLLHPGGSHNSMTLVWLMLVLSLSDRVQFFTLSSVDSDGWLCNWKNPHDRAEMHRAYEHLCDWKAIPLSNQQAGLIRWRRLVCSMGAALSFLLATSRCLQQKWLPWVVSMTLVLCWWFWRRWSHYQKLAIWLYLGQNDGWFRRYRQAEIVVCTGLGRTGWPTIFLQTEESWSQKYYHGSLNGDMMSPRWEWVAQTNAIFLGQMYL